MSFGIQISIGDDSAFESVECEGEIGDYWPVRFAVDAFIVKSYLLPGERVNVSGIAMYRDWIVRMRVLHPVNDKPLPLYYGELSLP